MTSWDQFSENLEKCVLLKKNKKFRDRKEIRFIQWLSVPAAAAVAVILSLVVGGFIQSRFNQNLNYQAEKLIVVEELKEQKGEVKPSVEAQLERHSVGTNVSQGSFNGLSSNSFLPRNESVLSELQERSFHIVTFEIPEVIKVEALNHPFFEVVDKE